MSLDMSKTQSVTGTEIGRAVYSVPRVNLLPDEIFAERRHKRLQIGLGAATLVVVGALVGGYLVSAASVDSAKTELAAEQQRTDTLRAEEAKYSEVPRVLAEVEAAQTARSQAMVTDVLWSDQLNALAAAYPKTTWLRDMTVSLGVPVGAAPDAAVSVVPTGIGALTFNGTGLTHSDASAFMDVLESTPGYEYPYLTVSERTDLEGTVVVDFTVTVNLTADVLSHRFDPKAS